MKTLAVFLVTRFGKAFSSGDLNVSDTSINMPLYFRGVEAFPLKSNVMRPFPRRELDFTKTIFNGKVSSKRRTIQCAFGILNKKCGIFQKAFETNVEVTEYALKSACVVYNYIRKTQTIEIKGRRKSCNKNSKMSLLQLNTPLALDVLPLKHCRCKRSCITSWEMGSTSNIWATLAIRKGNVFVPTLHLTFSLNKKKINSAMNVIYEYN